MTAASRQWGLVAVVGLAAAPLVFVAGQQFGNRILVSTAADAALQDSEARANRNETATELVMVFISSVTCPASADPALPGIVMRIKERLTQRASESNLRLHTVGVGIDWMSDGLVNHFGEFGNFDELILGHNWLNSGALRYLWQEFPGVASIPQVVLTERMVDGLDRPLLGITNERLIGRYVGRRELERWLANGVPMAR